MTQQTFKNVVLALVFITISPTIGCSAGGGRQHGPPPEAIAACEEKAVGETVEFTGRQGETLTATCQEIEGQLVAVPEGMEGGRPPKQ